MMKGRTRKKGGIHKYKKSSTGASGRRIAEIIALTQDLQPTIPHFVPQSLDLGPKRIRLRRELKLLSEGFHQRLTPPWTGRQGWFWR